MAIQIDGLRKGSTLAVDPNSKAIKTVPWCKNETAYSYGLDYQGTFPNSYMWFLRCLSGVVLIDEITETSTAPSAWANQKHLLLFYTSLTYTATSPVVATKFRSLDGRSFSSQSELVSYTYAGSSDLLVSGTNTTLNDWHWFTRNSNSLPGYEGTCFSSKATGHPIVLEAGNAILLYAFNTFAGVETGTHNIKWRETDSY